MLTNFSLFDLLYAVLLVHAGSKMVHDSCNTRASYQNDAINTAIELLLTQSECSKHKHFFFFLHSFNHDKLRGK
jgi:hypothetical protein